MDSLSCYFSVFGCNVSVSVFIVTPRGFMKITGSLLKKMWLSGKISKQKKSNFEILKICKCITFTVNLGTFLCGCCFFTY